MDGPIVVATDFSVDSELAAECGVALARRWGCELALLHVFNDSFFATARQVYDPATWSMTEPILDARKRLSSRAGEIARRDGIRAEAETRMGRAAEQIAAYARERRARLAIVGAHGENLLGDAFLGGTALKTVEQSDIPVLVARRRLCADFATIVVGVDFSDSARRAAELAVAWFPDAGLTLLHAFSVPFESRMRLADATDEHIKRHREHERLRATREMEALCGQLPAPRARILVQYGHPAGTILERAEQSNADLIVVGRHGGGVIAERLLGSVTRNVLNYAECDVLLVP